MSLILFDIDGTLLRAGTDVHRASFDHAYRAVYGLPLTLDGIPAAGRTDTWLLAEPLRRRGVPDAEIWRLMPRAFEAMQAYTEEHLSDLRDRVLPGIPEVLSGLRERGALLGLLTGNLSRIAHAKMRHAGLDGYFDVGGFGEESEFRADLVPVALAAAGRSSEHPIRPGDVVVVGDTPFDVEAGKAHGTLTIGVATGGPTADELIRAGADLTLESFADSQRALRSILDMVNRRS